LFARQRGLSGGVFGGPAGLFAFPAARPIRQGFLPLLARQGFLPLLARQGFLAAR